MISRSLSLNHWSFRLSNRKVQMLSLVSILGALGGYKYANDEGLQRAIRFNSVSIAPLVKYRYYDWKTKDWPKEKRDQIFQELHEYYAPIALNLILELKGFYIKVGQLGAGLVGLIPTEYTETLKVLQSNCPTRPIKEVIQTIENELGKPFNEVFLTIEPNPIGSASIGQVHRATLLDGQVVAVKVQHPDAERFFRVDVATSRAFLRLAQPEQLAFFDEIEKQFVSEFDYTLEAQNLRDMRDSVNKWDLPEGRTGIVVPEPIISTKKLLVMSFVKGDTLQSKQKKYLKELAEKEKKTVEKIEAEFKEKIEKGLVSKPPSPMVISAYRKAIQARDSVRNGFAFVYNSLFGYWVGAPIFYHWNELPMNAPDALSLLYQFHGHSVLKLGVFSSDPHAGNVMHVEGEKLGLIDMGQVKRIDRTTRVNLARLIVTLAHDDLSDASTKKIAKIWRECGYKTAKNDDQTTADCARFYFDRMTDDVAGRYGGIHVMLENMAKIDPLIELPGEFIMAGRCSMFLRMNAMGLGYGLQGDKFARIAQFWEPYALEVLKENGEIIETNNNASLPIPA